MKPEINHLTKFKDKYGDELEFYVSSNLGQCSLTYRTDANTNCCIISSLEDLQKFSVAVEKFIEEASEMFNERQNHV